MKHISMQFSSVVLLGNLDKVSSIVSKENATKCFHLYFDINCFSLRNSNLKIQSSQNFQSTLGIELVLFVKQ